MVEPGELDNTRVLIVDDNEDIHRDFRDILVAREDSEEFQAMEMELFGDVPKQYALKFQVDSAFQGKEGVELVRAAVAGGEPYAVVFVDMRMPPGWDGLQTIDRLWQVDSNLEIVICTAYSDYSWDKIVNQTVGHCDKLLILKKPFDAIEVQQITSALVKKWNLGRQALMVQEELEMLVDQRTRDLRRAEESARHAEQRWRSLLDNAPNLIVVINKQGEVEFINHSLAGARAVDKSGHDFFSFFSPGHSLQIVNSIEKVFQTGEAPGCTVKGVDRAGREAWYEVQFGAIRQDGIIVSATLIATDVTERRDIEAQLLQGQKLEAIGRLAGGVAHDINNILGAIMGAASVLELELQPGDEKIEDVQRILSACRKGGQTTRDLLGFARKGKYTRENVSLNRAVHRIIELLKHTISKKIVLRVELDESLHFVLGDLSQIENTLMNICLNALDAMGGEGTLTIRTENFFQDDIGDGTAAAALPGNCVKLQIEDTGSGMDEETRSRVFEPFFTTKAQGEGTGLGMSMVYGVIKNHGGVVEVESKPGEGTVVEVVLPCSDQVASEVPSSPVSAMPSIIPQRGGVLVVDDEEMLLMSTKRILNKMGYKVYLADNGRAAIDEFLKHRSHIDAVLLDIMMPELDGYETFFELRKIDPNVKILLCSGYCKNDRIEELLDQGALGFVHKPYDVKILTQELEGVVLS